MDNLTQTLAQRALGTEGPVQAPPPNQPNRVPPAWDRWLMAEMMKRAYLNNWSPNPVMMKVIGERVYGPEKTESKGPEK